MNELLLERLRLLAIVDENVTRQREQIENKQYKQFSEFAVRQTAPHKIAIITALPKEAAAVRAVFDDGPMLPSTARSAIEFREISCPFLDDPTQIHKIILSRSVRMGNNSAAVAAAALLSDYPNVEDILLVGIAGGVPNLDAARSRQAGVDDHVRRGDIIVSDQVIQYDFVKMEEDSSENRSKSPQPSSRMLNVANRLEEEMALGKRPWEDTITRVGAQFKWRAPRADALYDYAGPTPVKIPHPKTPRRSGFPAVHRGSIGSANILLKSHSVRDELRRKHKIKAVEMEGSGIADAAWNFASGYLIVRGSCDYCDRSKDGKWQDYAALIAAAYAKAIIERILP
jgi:nucleoside phosphorylase